MNVILRRPQGRHHAGLSTFTGIVPQLVDQIHLTTGLPWWATFVGAAASVRVVLFPVLRSQMKAQQRFAAAMPKLEPLLPALIKAEAMNPKQQQKDKWKAVRLAIVAWRLHARAHDCRLRQMLAAPLVYLPVFFSIGYGIRQIIRQGGHGLETGGFYPFIDLTALDTSYMLPIAAVASTYLNLEIARSSSKGTMASIIQVFQYIPVLSFPFVASTLPQGVFIYWISSSSLAMAQTLLLQNKTILGHVLPLATKSAAPPPLSKVTKMNGS